MKLHMIGNAHLDPVWFWRWTEGYHEVKATFRSALDRMNENGEYIFTCAGAAYYEWIEQDEPTMFEEIRRRVAEGRWCIVGGWWIQPDCNAPMGESFARQGLIAQRYYISRFGHGARTGYNVDSFGHNSMLPQILRLSGMNAYVFMRPMKHEKTLPSNIFLWRSADGSTLPAFRIPIAYCSWAPDIEARMRDCITEMPSDAPAAMGFYGVGNHGGGPTKENLASIDRLMGEMDLTYSSPDRFFDTLAVDSLPVVEGELLHHASGCYSVLSQIKRRNRECELALLSAERWCTVAERVLGRVYPQNVMEDSWKTLLFNQFHDILSGTCAQETYDDTFDQLGGVRAAAQKLMNAAIQAVSWRINIPMRDGDRPLVVFNTLPYPIVGQIEYQTEAPAEGLVLRDASGDTVPMQLTWGTSPANGRRTALFEAALPPLGYRVLYARRAETDAAPAAFPERFELENDFLCARISPLTGFVESLLDKKANMEGLNGASCVPVVVDDAASDTWAHGVFTFRQDIGTFTLSDIRWTEYGSVRQVIRATFTWRSSTIVQTYTLWRGQRHLDVKVEINWQESLCALKWSMQCAGASNESCAETAFGVSRRLLDGIEYPMHAWVRVGCVTCLNDSKYAYDAQDGALRITLLRSPRYAHHTPKCPGENEFYPFIDQGWQTVRLALTTMSMTNEETCVLGQTLNMPPVALLETFHDGVLLPEMSFARARGGVVTCVKEAEDGTGDLIARLVEVNGQPSDASFMLFGTEYACFLAPYEIATLRIDGEGKAIRTNFLEQT